jgi:hypothetical protein
MAINVQKCINDFSAPSSANIKSRPDTNWIDECTQTRTHKVHLLEEVDMLTAKIDLRKKKLEDPGLDHLKMVDAWMACEGCRETGHMGINCPTTCLDVNFVGNSNNGFRSNQGFNSGWNKPNFPFDNHQQGSNGKKFNRNELSLKDIVTDQVRINADIGKKFLANNKVLQSIESKMNNFTVQI